MSEITEWLGFGPSDLRAPLIGRAADMRELEQALAEVLDLGETRIVTVIGPPGVGKSRLIHDFWARMRSATGSLVRMYRANVPHGRDSYGLFGRILKSRFGLADGVDETIAKQRVRGEVAAVLGDRKVDDVVYFLGQLIGLRFPDSPLTRAVAEDALEASVLRRTAIRSFLDADSARSPMCLVLDDLHRAHDESLALLEFLLEHSQGPVLALCVARQELVTRRDGWCSIRKDSHRVLELGPLGDDDAAAMMHALLAPCGEPPQRLVGAADRLASGNPLLLEQMVRIFHDTGVLEEEDTLGDTPVWRVHLDKLDAVRLPLTVDDAAQARVAALVPAHRLVLEKAAAIGSVFWLGALTMLDRIDNAAPDLWAADDNEEERHLREILRELVARNYIVQLPDSTFPHDEEFAFRNNLERECVTKGTRPSLARIYHRAVAEWLSQKRHIRSDEEHLAKVAWHLDAAGCKRCAALSYLEAGDAARSCYALRKALEYYDRGFELLGSEDLGRQMDACHNEGDVFQQLGRMADALSSFRRMLSIAHRLNLRAKGGAAHNRIGRAYREMGDLDQAALHLDAGLSLFVACHDERGVASSLDDIGKVHWLCGDCRKALEQMDRALLMRRRLGDKRSIGLSLNNVGLVLQDLGRFADALDLFHQALEVRREIGDVLGVVATLNNLGTVAQDQGDLDGAIRTFAEALALAREVGDRRKIAMVLTNLGEAQRAMGRLDQAAASFSEATAMSDDVREPVRVGQCEQCGQCGPHGQCEKGCAMHRSRAIRWS